MSKGDADAINDPQLDPSLDTPSGQLYQVNDKITAKLKGQWYPAQITAVHTAGRNGSRTKYDISYDDYKEQTRLAPNTV